MWLVEQINECEVWRRQRRFRLWAGKEWRTGEHHLGGPGGGQKVTPMLSETHSLSTTCLIICSMAGDGMDMIDGQRCSATKVFLDGRHFMKQWARQTDLVARFAQKPPRTTAIATASSCSLNIWSEHQHNGTIGRASAWSCISREANNQQCRWPWLQCKWPLKNRMLKCHASPIFSGHA